MQPGTFVITFARTLDAFAFEDAARTSGVPGRLIPLPTAIAASCGLAWRLPADAVLPHPLPRHEGVYRHDGAAFARLDD